MKKQYFEPERDGFYGVYYPNPASNSKKAIIAMLGDSSDDWMAASGVKWLHKRGCNVMAMSPDKKDYGHHNYPLERFGRAIGVLKDRGNDKIGIVGASTTGMMALVTASFYPEITLTIALTPPDFIMEGFYQGNKDGAREWPSDGSSVTWQGQPLPYLPYAYRHPQYWQQIMADSKAGGDQIASRPMFEESERRHPVREEEKIKVENIKGKLIFVGAEDDVLWDTCKYVRRMMKRLEARSHECEVEALLYEHGTHFVFPQTMLTTMLPAGSGLLVRFMFKAGRQYPKACKQTRIDIDEKLSNSILKW
ncbi:MAG: acyl-CoA thioester hydrolase/BAAT C-terminal domain-containing protein [Eubacteriales bacterium]|nr:acyl-CoA thioester hydrolase/BAAT C-terminal domain-containing protein [Eubacteriales bacterium]